MKIHFLGTAAAEGWPGVFCRCEHCVKARKLGGKNIRTRSSAIIDDTIKIDLPPDTYYHVLRDNLDLAAIEHLLITHTHSDHLQPDELEKRTPVCAHGVDHPLHIYGHDLALHKVANAINMKSKLYELHLVHPFQSVQIDETTTITPLLADHDKRKLQTCLLYAIEKNGKSLLYGHDSGWFPEATWSWLMRHTFDGVILDCTNGPLPGRSNHLNIDAVVEIQDIFRKNGMLRDHAKVVATHFSHNGGLLHEELEHVFAPHQIIVAYDGMILNL